MQRSQTQLIYLFWYCDWYNRKVQETNKLPTAEQKGVKPGNSLRKEHLCSLSLHYKWERRVLEKEGEYSVRHDSIDSVSFKQKKCKKMK